MLVGQADSQPKKGLSAFKPMGSQFFDHKGRQRDGSGSPAFRFFQSNRVVELFGAMYDRNLSQLQIHAGPLSLETNWRNQDEKASSGRPILHTKIDELRRDFHDWKGKLEAVITDVAEMKPTVDEVRTAKQRAIGALMVSRPLYALALFMTAGITWVLANWIKISIK